MSLLNDVLDFSKMEAGQLHLERISFDMRAVLQNSANLMQPAAQQKVAKPHNLNNCPS
jgi:signal transduction histidine kinase